MPKKIAVVILNWNGVDHLKTYLPSVLAYSNPQLADIYVIDNNSTDNSIAFLEQHYPSIKLVINAANGGFAKGYNDGLKHIDASYYILLNSDVEVTPNWIEPLLANMEANPDWAACQPKILDYKNKTKFEHAGAAGGYIDKFGFPFCRGRLFDSLEEDVNQYQDNQEVFWATGACLCIRKELYHEFGGFDESFFAHMEEIDLCWRLKNQAHKIAYVAASRVYHLGGGTLSAISPNKTYLNFRNNLYLLYRNLPDTYLYRTIFARMVFDGVAFFHFLFSAKVAHAKAVFKAHMHFYKNFGKLRAFRNSNQNKSKMVHLKGVYNASIVFAFYLNKIKKFTQLDSTKFS